MNSIKVLFLFLIFSLPIVSNAQVFFGAKLGGHLANLSTDEENRFEFDFSSKFGINFSVYMDVPISQGFSIQPEVAHISKGAKFIDTFGSNEKSILTLNYLDICLLGKYTFGDEDIKISVTVGPTYGYILKGFSIIDDEKEEFDFDDDDFFKRKEFGLNIGGGVALPIDFGELTMDVRYLVGMTNIFKDIGDSTIKNRGFGINMGIRFPLSEGK